MAELQAFEKDYRRRLAELEESREKLSAERDQAMLDAHAAGIPIVEIANVFSISHQRVSSLVRKS